MHVIKIVISVTVWCQWYIIARVIFLTRRTYLQIIIYNHFVQNTKNWTFDVLLDTAKKRRPANIYEFTSHRHFGILVSSFDKLRF